MTLREFGLAGRLYFLTVVATGVAAIAWAVADLWQHPTINVGWFILAALSLVSGRAALKLPSVHSILSFSETFLITAALLYGPAAGALTVALEAAVVSLSPKTTPYKGLFTLCANSLAMLIGAELFFYLARLGPATTWTTPVAISALWMPVGLFVATYFGLSSWLVAMAVAFERRASAIYIWRKSFAWLFLNYSAGAFAATVLVGYAPQVDPRYLLVLLPLVGLIYYTYVTSIGRVEDANKHLVDLNDLYLSTIEALAMAIDAKDQVTHGHIRRVQLFAVALARSLGIEDETHIRAIEAASLLHDMGKLAVPDYILNKPGPLTPAEFERMKTHASVGADILSSVKFPYPVVPIVRHHHENWNGTGYPDGLKEADIPIGARILAVVDCFDALTSDRPYRPRLTEHAALEIIRDRRGKMYDPHVVDRFELVREQIAGQVTMASFDHAPLAAITQAAGLPAEEQAQVSLHEIAASSEEMLTLYEIGRAVSGPFRLDDAAEMVARHLRRLIPATYCVFYSYEASTDELVASYASGDSSRLFTGLRITMGQRLTGWVGANRQTILNSDPILDLGDPARAVQPALRSALSTPLVADGSLVGVLSLYAAAKDAFTENHGRIIEAVARQVSGSLRNAIRYDERQQASLRDELTGLPSVERLRHIVGATTDGHAASRVHGALILIDVDELHVINAQRGRNAGDEVLAEVAAVISRTLPGTDLLFRGRSDEFIVFLPKAEPDYARGRAEVLRSAVLRSAIDSPIPGRPVSVSVAIALVPVDGESVEAALAVAASRLQRLNHPGRDSGGFGAVH